MRQFAPQLGLRLAASALPKAGAVIIGSPRAGFGKFRKISSSRDERPLPRWRAFLHIAGCAIAFGGSDLSRADVLYDTSDMIINQTYDTSCETFIGGFTTFGEFRDEQAADDFELAGNYRITKVTGYYLTSDPTSPDGGVLVEFFADVNGRPSEVPAAATLSPNYTLKTFKDTVFGTNAFSLSVDLSDSDISLDTGVWWVSITPVDETPLGLKYNQWRQLDLLNGSIVHGRGGGQDHGTGYAGHFYGGDDWLEFGREAGCCDPGDLAMKIEGTLVGGEPCPADLDGSGDVGVKDLLTLLGVWGPCPPKGECPADFDDSGDIGVKDLLTLLGVWGPCP